MAEYDGSDSTAERAGSYHHGDLRSALLSHALQIVDADGPDSITLRGIAKAAGVSRAAPYHHFKDKRTLLAAVAASGFRQLAAQMRGKLADRAAPRTRLDQLGVGYVEFSLLHGELFRLMQGADFRKPGEFPDLDAARNESAAPLIETVSACLPDASEQTIRSACASAWSMVHGMAQLSADGRIDSLLNLSNLEKAVGAVTQSLNLEVYE